MGLLFREILNNLTTNMFNKREKIIKKAGQKPSDLEEEIAKSIHSLERSHTDKKQHLGIIFLNSAHYVDYTQSDGTAAQYILVKIPHRSSAAFRKVGKLVQEELEKNYDKQVIVVANRTIISPGAKSHPSQMRPRSRCLTVVHKESSMTSFSHQPSPEDQLEWELTEENP